jgi:hypothetical protein
MAAIDKIYGTISQYEELRDWLTQNKPEALVFLYSESWSYSEWWDGEDHPISNFPESIDTWLLENCPIDWVIEAINEQYGLVARRGGLAE